ncbi:hypothetical protein K1719_033897 [Acacia pycnantha]|nr:hypothetical protein K1719_033897 [Acacia pycnantha]
MEMKSLGELGPGLSKARAWITRGFQPKILWVATPNIFCIHFGGWRSHLLAHFAYEQLLFILKVIRTTLPIVEDWMLRDMEQYKGWSEARNCSE